jgi:hypothetical protein
MVSSHVSICVMFLQPLAPTKSLRACCSPKRGNNSASVKKTKNCNTNIEDCKPKTFVWWLIYSFDFALTAKIAVQLGSGEEEWPREVLYMQRARLARHSPHAAESRDLLLMS